MLMDLAMNLSTLAEIASAPLLSANDRLLANLLVAACNDRPEPDLTHPFELVAALAKELTKALTLAHLTQYAARLDPAYDAWKMESTVSVIEFLQRSVDRGMPAHTPLADAIEQFGKRCARA
jgi:hypothetical protein